MMPQPLIDKYTRSLYNILYIDNIDIWQNIEFNLPQNVNLDDIKDMFVAKYKYREIGVETVSLWLDYLNNKVILLNKEYTNLFNAFSSQYTDADIYANSTGDFNNSQKRYATPQTQIDQVENYLTEQVDSSGNESYLRGMTKAHARAEYLAGLREIYYEYINEFDELFMGVF